MCCGTGSRRASLPSVPPRKLAAVARRHNVTLSFRFGGEAGGVVETPEGDRLRAPLDTTSAVAWMGYANPGLARQVRPLLKRLIFSTPYSRP